MAPGKAEIHNGAFLAMHSSQQFGILFLLRFAIKQERGIEFKGKLEFFANPLPERLQGRGGNRTRDSVSGQTRSLERSLMQRGKGYSDYVIEFSKFHDMF